MQVSVSVLLSQYLSGQMPVGPWKNYVHHPSMRIFNKHEALFREGEAAEAVFLLYKGKVMMVKQKNEGFYSIIATLHAGEIIGLPAAISALSYHTSVIAKSKVYTFRVLKEELLQYLADHPYCYFAVAKKLCNKIIDYESILSK